MKQLTASLAVLLLLFTGGCAQQPRLLPPPAPELGPQLAWAQVLQDFVTAQGRVDFQRLAGDRGALDDYVAWLAYSGPRSNPELFSTPEDELAFHINAYNALAMRHVLEKGIPRRLGFLRRVNFFYLSKLQVDSGRLSLYDYENQVIRGYNEPRIHFAINCMSLGCPRLPREPFTASALDSQLDRETRAFFARPDNLRIDHAARRVYVNELIEWFAEDFQAAAPSLLAYIDRYTEVDIPQDYTLEFLPYDWHIASAQ